MVDQLRHIRIPTRVRNRRCHQSGCSRRVSALDVDSEITGAHLLCSAIVLYCPERTPAPFMLSEHYNVDQMDDDFLEIDRQIAELYYTEFDETIRQHERKMRRRHWRMILRRIQEDTPPSPTSEEQIMASEIEDGDPAVQAAELYLEEEEMLIAKAQSRISDTMTYVVLAACSASSSCLPFADFRYSASSDEEAMATALVHTTGGPWAPFVGSVPVSSQEFDMTNWTEYNEWEEEHRVPWYYRYDPLPTYDEILATLMPGRW